jgi:hypothetical protein
MKKQQWAPDADGPRIFARGVTTEERAPGALAGLLERMRRKGGVFEAELHGEREGHGGSDFK